VDCELDMWLAIGIEDLASYSSLVVASYDMVLSLMVWVAFALRFETTGRTMAVGQLW
jgi:hypothetical protein